jgi:hypothetical protein
MMQALALCVHRLRVMENNIKVGDKVKLTGKFLRSTGQGSSKEGRKTWTVTAISGSFAVTDEKHPADYAHMMWTDAELAADPSLWFRRIALGNLFKVGTVTVANCV